MDLLHNRAILLAAIKELLALAEMETNPDLRIGYVKEATRLGLRLMKVIREIEDRDLD